MEMSKGTIKRFSAVRDYGFIAQDGGGPDVFVHLNATVTYVALLKDQRVDFDVKTDRRTGKPNAVNVRVIAE
jgi:CspA family cold shock protein